MHERKNICKEVGTLDMDGLTLSEAIKHLQELAAEHGTAAKIEKENYQYEDGSYWAVYKYVPEIDEQMNTRIAMDIRRKQLQEDREKRQLTELLAKHGVPNAK